jgi:hypothetical protein
MTHHDEPLLAVAEVLLTTAPALVDRAWNRLWVTADGVDWDLFLSEWYDSSGAWSGGEQRLIAAVAALADSPTSGTDSGNAAALVSALRAGAAVAERRHQDAERGEALLARLSTPGRKVQ